MKSIPSIPVTGASLLALVVLALGLVSAQTVTTDTDTSTDVTPQVAEGIVHLKFAYPDEKKDFGKIYVAAGDTMLIKWKMFEETDPLPPVVKLQYRQGRYTTFADTAKWQTITDKADGMAGEYEWQVPGNLIQDDYFLMLSAPEYGNYQVTVSIPFKIYQRLPCPDCSDGVSTRVVNTLAVSGAIATAVAIAMFV